MNDGNEPFEEDGMPNRHVDINRDGYGRTGRRDSDLTIASE